MTVANAIFDIVLYIGLLTHIGLIAASVYTFWKRTLVFDRLIIADLVATYILALLVILAMLMPESLFLDVGLGLAAIGFIGAIALAKYIADQQMF
jgi:multisubunit Na+/H+ antiporter MnhF subunit